MDMASTEELGLVWMGDMLLHNDPGGLMLNSALDPHTRFFSDTQQTLDDVRHTTPMYVQDMNGFVMLDELEDPYYEETEDDEEKKLMTTSGTQTNPNFGPNRKIKPVKHPALKLQTPIAYQRDTDLNVIPIQRDGMAVCEKCGAIGVKHAFYTRERRFCSLACARGSTDSLTQAPQDPLAIDSPHSQPCSETEMDSSGGVRVHHTLGGLPKPPPPLPEDEPPLFPPDRRTLSHLLGTYEWLDMLAEPGFSAAPVSAFYHAPMANCWDNITVGMKVEVENTDCDNYSEGVPDSFWVATVLRVAGYKALLRYEGFGQNESKDFWVNLCSSKVHPVGWCATRGKPLIPPKTIEDKYKDWKHFLVKRLTGARTLPSNFYSKVHENMKSRFRCDLNLEVVDKNRISQVKVATIKKIVGKRLHVKYYDADSSDNGFWAHEDSPLIHPVGWAKRVGQTLAAPPAYVDRCLKGLRDKDDATEDLFPLHNSMGYHTGFKREMKLEAVDPLNLSSVCVATIMKVLNEGYLMIRIDSYDEDISSPGSDWFCYHASSACLMPPGFCDMHSLRLTPPKGYDPATFHWPDYLSETGSVPAPPNLFDIECPEHSFVVGQRLEAADLMDPRLVCVATVSQIVGRLIKVHFDGWEEEYDQWLDCTSPDMYPVGWCELVSHKLEGPQAASVLKPSPQQSGVCVGTKTHHDGRTHKRRKGGRRGGGRGGGKTRGGEAEGMTGTGASNSPIPQMACTPSLSLNSQPTKPSGELVAMSSVGYDDDGAIEMGEEPTGPDQSLPDELPLLAETNFPIKNDIREEEIEIKEEEEEIVAKVDVNNIGKLIPRLIGGTSGNFSELSRVTPEEWDETDVAMFLRINDCAAYCDSFTSRKINGKMLLELTKDEIIDLTGMKVGPSVKIHDLIQQLKIKVNPAQERMKAGLKKLF